jgi:hypothetical protein
MVFESILHGSPKQTHLPRVVIADGFLPRFRRHTRCHRHLFDAFGGLVAGLELLEDFFGSGDDVFGEATSLAIWMP